MSWGKTADLAAETYAHKVYFDNGFYLTKDSNGNLGYFNPANTEILFFDSNGNLIFVGTSIPQGSTTGIGTDGSGNLYLNVPTSKVIQLSVNSTGILNVGGTGLTSFLGIATSGIGATIPYRHYLQSGKSAAVTNAINYTPPAIAGTYLLFWTVNVTTSTTYSFTVVATWHDAEGNARSQNLGGWDPTGSALVAGAITNVIGAGVYYGMARIDINNSATAITLSTAGTFTTVTYDLGADLLQVA